MAEMKKILSLFLAITLVFSLTACGQSSEDGTEAPTETETTERNVEVGAGKVLVAYFSWADNAVLEDGVDAVTSPSVVPPGDVQQLAGWVQEETGGDLFSIRVTDPYPSDWDACLERANEERGDDARPQLQENVEDMGQYDTVFLGYPKMEQGYICV